jgi:hypothetical protein
MNIGDPIEEQAVRLWCAVFGNVAMTLEEARRGFYQQEPSVIAGWERLARSVFAVTTPATVGV